MRFIAARGSRIRDDDAELVAKVLTELIHEKGLEGVTPDQMVDVARPRRSPLHRLFQWNNKLAAKGFRYEQARGYLRWVHVVEDDNDGNDETRPPVRYFHSMNRTDVEQPDIDPFKESILIQHEDASTVQDVIQTIEQDIPVAEKRNPIFVPLTEIVRNPNYHAQMVANALEELRWWTKKYETYQDLQYLVSVISSALPST